MYPSDFILEKSGEKAQNDILDSSEQNPAGATALIANIK